MWRRWRYHNEAEDETNKCVFLCVCDKQRRQYRRQMKSVFTSDWFVKSAVRIYGPWLHWEVTIRVEDLRN